MVWIDLYGSGKVSVGLSGQVSVGLKEFHWVWMCFSGSGWVSMAF